MLTEVLIALVLAITTLIMMSRNAAPKNLPPGPKGKPIIGVLPAAGQSFIQFMVELQQQYGDIFSVQVGSRRNVGLMRYDLIKEAFAMPQLTARPNLYTLQIFTRFTNTGIVFSSGRPWQNARRFAMTHLRDLGMGRSVMEDYIHEEARALVRDFEKNMGGPMEVANNVNVAILNVIWKMVAGERFDVTNEAMQKLTINVEDSFKMILGPMAMLDWFPWLHYLPAFVKRKYFETDRAQKNLDEITEFLEGIIREHQNTLDPTNLRDYIDHYLVEMEAQKGDPNSTFRQDLLDLTISILDMYNAGSETTSSTLRWLILYMAVHPHVQDKVQQEIDQLVPRHRLPELQDNLPYLDAMIAETSRHISLVPFGVPHMATEDVTLAGYNIPKDTIVLGYLKGCHEDAKLWGDPQQFRPERFIGGDGKFVNKEFLVPFSTGRRQCMGESVARMELKLFAGTVLQQFRISAPDGVVLNTTHDEPDYREGVINSAKPYKVVLTKRFQS